MTAQDAEGDADSHLLDQALSAITRLEASIADEHEALHMALHSENLLDTLTNLSHTIAEEREQLDALDLVAPGRWAAEEFHSKIISWLLDPSAHHQQAERFIVAYDSAEHVEPFCFHVDLGVAA